MFELAVLDLKEAEALELHQRDATVDKTVVLEKWKTAIKSALNHLDKAMALATNSTDLSSRLDTRVSMLRDEIATKKEMLGIQ